MAEINKNNANMDFPLQIARQYGAPLDKDSVFYSLVDAQTYASFSPLAYVGQVIAVVDESANTVDVYKINTDGTLGSVGAGGGVTSVNGETGNVSVTAESIGAFSPNNLPTAVKDVNNEAKTTFEYSKDGVNWNDFTWLAGWINDGNGNHLRAMRKPTANDIGAQPTLVSGNNIKTVNGQSLLGSGDLAIKSDGLEIAPLPTVNLPSSANVELGYAQGAPEELLQYLRDAMNGSASEVGRCMGVALQADQSGHPEIAETLRQMAKCVMGIGVECAEATGDLCTVDTIQNLSTRIEAVQGKIQGLYEASKIAKQNNLDALHDFLHEYSRHEYLLCQALRGLYAQYANMNFESVVTKLPKWVCGVCGYVIDGDTAPTTNCPQCNAPASKFVQQEI